MENEIIENIENPGILEDLYRSDKKEFTRAFHLLHPQIGHRPVAAFWYARLGNPNVSAKEETHSDIPFLLIAVFIAGLLMKIPAIFGISEDFFYPRNFAFMVFPFLATYFIYRNPKSTKSIAALAAGLVISVLYINLLPMDNQSDTMILACIHLPFVLWGFLLMVYSRTKGTDHGNKLSFLRFNGDLVVMTALLFMACGILTALTLALFELAGLPIENFFFRNIALVALPAVPLIACHLIETNPNLVERISPLIARIFSPMVLLMLVIYLIAIAITGKEVFNDRDFLLLFNIILIGVLALIFFSIAEQSYQKNLSRVWILMLLATVSVVVNGIALAAILFRISEWGFTPNRVAVLGGNILILIHLIMVGTVLARTLLKHQDLSEAGKAITNFIPVYPIWAAIVVLLFPVLFGFQ